VSDIHVPLLLWWASSRSVGSDADAVLVLFADKGLWERPIVRQHIREKLCAASAQAAARKDCTSATACWSWRPDRTTSSADGRVRVGVPGTLAGPTCPMIWSRDGARPAAVRRPCALRQGDEKATRTRRSWQREGGPPPAPAVRADLRRGRQARSVPVLLALMRSRATSPCGRQR